MGITDLIRKRKAMHFQATYGGSAKKSGMLGAGVEKYEGKSIGEKLNDLKAKVSQKRSEVLLRKSEAKEAPKKVSGFNLASGGVRTKSGTRLSDKIKQRWEDRAKNTGGGMFGNQSNSIFNQQSQSGGLNPIFHGGTGGGQRQSKQTNPGNNIFTTGSGSNPFTFNASAPASKASPVKKKVITYYK